MKTTFCKLAICFVALTNMTFADATEGDTSLLKRDNLSGYWGGKRNSLESHGYTFEFVYSTDYMANVSGGAKTGGQRLDNADLSLTIDAQKAFGLRDTNVFIYFIGNTGGSPSEYSQDMQGVSNIDAPDTFKLYEAWLEKNISNNFLSFKFGLYDLNSEFDSIETAGLFLNSSHGIGPDFSQSGENAPSIFPTTSLGFRFRLSPSENSYVQGVVLDGVPGDINNPYGTHISYSSDEGLLFSGEAGMVLSGENTHYTKTAIGAWYYSKAIDMDIAGNTISPKNNSGVYALAERMVYAEDVDHEQGLSLYARYGIANKTLNAIASYLGFGAVYTGLFPGRNNDQIGLAIADANGSTLFYDTLRAAGVNATKREVNLELTYRAQVLKWLAIQPDVQYVLDPGMSNDVANALLIGSRFEIVF